MIAERDGIHVGDVVCDARSTEGAVNVVSHAHTDHLPRSPPDRAVASDVTAALAAARTGSGFEPVDHQDIELVPSGHIVGSRAAVIEHDGRRVLYTGDVSTRDRLHLDGFEPRDADVLVLETTYGVPAYTFPDFAETRRDVLDWIAANPDRPLVLAGYALGKAQTVQKIVEGCGRRVLAHERVSEMNSAVERAAGLAFEAAPLAGAGELQDELVVVPPGAAGSDRVEAWRREHGARTAGFTGWAAAGRRTRRYDRAFPLSDHCGFDELDELVRAVDPERVYTHHGFDEAFASHVRSEMGIEARALSDAQRTLRGFSR